MSKITSGDPRCSRGRKRQTELGLEMKETVALTSKAMLDGLGRPYSVGERFIAEAIAALYLRAARLRNAGRNDLELLREAATLQQGSIFASPAGRPMPLIEPSEK